MNIWHDISSDRIKPEQFTAVIEIEKGSKTKYELDKETGMLMIDRILSTSTQYPAAYGFIPKTLSEDGDPLDVVVLCSERIRPMSLVTCYPVAVIRMIDGGEHDEKIVAVVKSDKIFNEFTRLEQLPHHVINEMVHFFTVYKDLEGKKTSIEKVEDENMARQVIVESIERYNQKYAK